MRSTPWMVTWIPSRTTLARHTAGSRVIDDYRVTRRKRFCRKRVSPPCPLVKYISSIFHIKKISLCSALSERCLSGWKDRSWKPAYVQAYRGFESHPLRHFPVQSHPHSSWYISTFRGPPECWNISGTMWMRLDREVAERVGFEPTVRLHVRRFSRPVLSTTQAPLRQRRT